MTRPLPHRGPLLLLELPVALLLVCVTLPVLCWCSLEAEGRVSESAPVLVRSSQIVGDQQGWTAGCSAVQLLLERPLSEYYVLLRAADGADETAQKGRESCSLSAELLTEQGSNLAQCAASTLTARSPGRGGAASGATHEAWLRLQSSCQNVSAAVKALKTGAHARRQLSDSTPLLSLVHNFSGLYSMADNLNASPNQTFNWSGPPPGSVPPAVACCCGQNSQSGSPGASYGQCCCGPISVCCQTAGFCVTQNCTAIFVGSTLIAGALVSFMTCGICVYRARLTIYPPPGAFWSRRQAEEEAPRRQLQLVPVRAPADADEGRVRECPVCLEEAAANAHWAVFPCGHATCRPCYERLVAKPQQDAACPLCRAPLCEPVPEMVDPAAVVYVGPFPQEPAQALHVPGPSQPASYVQAPVGQRPAHMVVPEGAHSPTRLSPL